MIVDPRIYVTIFVVLYVLSFPLVGSDRYWKLAMGGALLMLPIGFLDWLWS